MAKKPAPKQPATKQKKIDQPVKEETKKQTVKKQTIKKEPIKKEPVKKQTIKKEEKKKPVESDDEIPKDVLNELKTIHKRYFKNEKFSEVMETYKEILEETKEKFKQFKWKDEMKYHKRAISSIKNRKKKESVGGAVDNYYGVILGSSKIVDLSAKRRSEILKIYSEDIDQAINEGMIMTTTSINPETAEEERVPVLNKKGDVIPRDNREFFKRKDGSQFKNNGYGKPIPRSLKKTLIGVCQTTQGIKGVFLMELRDKIAENKIPMNCFVKFTARTLSSTSTTINDYPYYDKELLKNMITTLDDDAETGEIDPEFAKEMKQAYRPVLKEEEVESTMFKLRNSRGTTIIRVKNEDELERIDLPKLDNETPDINMIYKSYMYPHTSDCANILRYHNDNKYIIKKDKEGNETFDTNWDEFVSLQDIKILQLNMEVSMSGNYTLYGEDDSFYLNDTTHNEKEIDSIKLLVPSEIEIDFGQDSRVNLVGSIFQFPAQDEEGNDITETVEDEEGNEVDIVVLDFPTIMVYGIYAIPEYKVEVEVLDMTDDEGIDVDELFDTTLEEEEDMKEAIAQVKQNETGDDEESDEYNEEEEIEETEEEIDESEYIDDEPVDEDIEEEPW